jgi:hypothetical protein
MSLHQWRYNQEIERLAHVVVLLGRCEQASIFERVATVIQDHAWPDKIVTAVQVLLYTSNADAYFDEYRSLDGYSTAGTLETLAAAAMEADVWDLAEKIEGC